MSSPALPDNRSQIVKFVIGVLIFTIITLQIISFSAAEVGGFIAKGTFDSVDYGSRLPPLFALLVTSIILIIILRSIDAYFWASFFTSPAVPKALILMGSIAPLIGVWVLRAFPNSGDEYTYILHAKTFLAGRLWNHLPPDYQFFSLTWMVEKDGKWVSQYPPGWPLLLAAVRLVRLPFWVASPLLGGALLLLLEKFCRRESGNIGVVIALTLIALSPFFVFNSASYFSHTPAALFGLLFCLYAARILANPQMREGLFAGASLGALGLVRPFDVVFFAIPFGVQLLRSMKSKYCLCTLPIILGGLPFLAALLLYNYSITGDPLTQVMQWGLRWKDLVSDSVDFNSPNSPITLLNTVKMTGIRVMELAEWTSPLIILMYVMALIFKITRSLARFYDFIPCCTILAYLIYGALPNATSGTIPWPTSVGGDQYGPRYYFEVYPLMAITISSAIVSVCKFEVKGGFRNLGNILSAHVIICLVGCTIIGIYMRRIVDERMDLYDQVRRVALHHAVVLVRADAGRLRPMGILDLVRNGLRREGDVVYVHDAGEPRPLMQAPPSELRALFPERQFYGYGHEDDHRVNVIVPLE